ncbi:AAA family ATPase [Domibacillus sp. A3M-37]|nr:AAA family ATPase [Domibacillus sp. A3M-37]
MRKIYILSGPAGVGKSTTSQRLAEQLDHSAYIEGDVINHMVIGGYLPPWESKEAVALIWENIADLSINFVQANKDVVIDYVAFPKEVEEFSRKVYAKVKSVEIMYIVLWVDSDELLRRDALRIKEHQMGVRCLELVNEFESKEIDKRFFYNTTDLKPSNLDEIISNIKENPSFLFSSHENSIL